MLLIGLSGKKGVGKNFVADRIDEYAASGGMKVEKAAFADPLKEFCINVLGLPRKACYGSDAEKNALTHYRWDRMPDFVKTRYPHKSGLMSVREVLQVFGTDFIRDCWDAEAWVNTMARRVNRSDADVFVITDLRFPNEAGMVQALDGEVWKIDGPQRGEEAKKNDAHSSETALDSIQPNEVIRNSKDDTSESIMLQLGKLIGGKSEHVCCHAELIVEEPNVKGMLVVSGISIGALALGVMAASVPLKAGLLGISIAFGIYGLIVSGTHLIRQVRNK